ncbi:MAG: DUF4390 domain-containing protein [Gammaproteobacteria bacterium]
MRHSRHNGSPALRRTAAILVALVLAVALVPRAEAAGFVQVLKASMSLRDGVWYLDADVAWSPSEAAREALDSGVTLDVILRVAVSERRRFLWDPDVAELEQRYELQYHALTQRFILRNLNSGQQRTFATLDAALRALSEVRQLPVLDDALLDDDEQYDVGLKAEMDMKQLGGPLALISFLWNDWQLESEWERWPLQR